MRAVGSALVKAFNNDDGAGGILALMIVGAAALAASLVGVGCGVAIAQARSSATADSAALAAASVAAGFAPGDPCDAAALVSTANGASLARCDAVGTEVYVQCNMHSGGITVFATARAGQPETHDR